MGEAREIENIPAEVLNQILCNFFMTVKRKDGKEYEPSSPSSFQPTFQRILIDKGSKINIKLDPQFEKSRKVLAARRKELTSMGYGNKPNAARNLEDEEIDVLYSKGCFGKHDPWALQITVWWVTGLLFGFRARDEARKLKWGDIAVVKEANGEERLVFKTERGTKTRTVEKPHGSKRKFGPPAYATGTERCPVGLYRFFEAQRPKAMNEVGSPLYLAINTTGWNNSKSSWYLEAPLGKNTMGSFLSKARALLEQDTGSSSGKVSNHSCRKAGITRMLEADVPPHLVAQLSGHKRVESLQSYHSASKKQQKRMSDILSYGDESAENKRADSPSFCLQQTSRAQKQFRPTCTITTPLVEISDNATTNMQSGSSTSSIVGAPDPGNRISVPSDSGLTTVPRTQTNQNPDEFVSMFAGAIINNCVFQFSQNPVHGIPSSLKVITDNDHKDEP